MKSVDFANGLKEFDVFMKIDLRVLYGGVHFSKHRSMTSASIFDISAFRSMRSR